MFLYFFFIIHFVLVFLLVFFILLQQGKGAEAGMSFGEKSMQLIFGSKGSSDFMFKVTIVLIILFFITTFTISKLVISSKDFQQPKISSEYTTAVSTTFDSQQSSSLKNLSNSIMQLPKIPD